MPLALLLLLDDEILVLLAPGEGEFVQMSSHRPNAEFVEPKRAYFLLVEFIEFGGEVAEVALQLEPVHVGDEQVLPILFALDAFLGVLQQQVLVLLLQGFLQTWVLS